MKNPMNMPGARFRSFVPPIRPRCFVSLSAFAQRRLRRPRGSACRRETAVAKPVGGLPPAPAKSRWLPSPPRAKSAAAKTGRDGDEVSVFDTPCLNAGGWASTTSRAAPTPWIPLFSCTERDGMLSSTSAARGRDEGEEMNLGSSWRRRLPGGGIVGSTPTTIPDGPARTRIANQWGAGAGSDEVDHAARQPLPARTRRDLQRGGRDGPRH